MANLDQQLQATLQDFTDRMDAVTHMDVHSGTWIYRVFLLANTLQVDINSKGEVLMRHRVAADPKDDLKELIWEMGILRGNILHPISFKRPANSKGLLWRTMSEIDGDARRFDDRDRVQFSAFYGDVVKFYKLTPK